MLQLKRLKHQFLHGGQPSGSAEHLHRLGQLGGGGEGGGDADIAVLRVLMVYGLWTLFRYSGSAWLGCVPELHYYLIPRGHS